jgi:hypothetical protein
MRPSRQGDVAPIPIWELQHDGKVHCYEWTNRQLYDAIVEQLLQVRRNSTSTTSSSSNHGTSYQSHSTFHLRDLTSFLRPIRSSSSSGSSYNYHPPTWIVRRNFMILTIDPLRLILFHDRLYLHTIIPSTTDSYTTTTTTTADTYSSNGTTTTTTVSSSILWIHICQQRLLQQLSGVPRYSTTTTAASASVDTSSSVTNTNYHHDEATTTTTIEFQHIDQRILLQQEPFELQVVHIILGTITSMYSQQFTQLHHEARTITSLLTTNPSRGTTKSFLRRYWHTNSTQNNNNNTNAIITTATTTSIHETFAHIKNQTKALEAQFVGLLRVIQDILDDEGHLALMNLSSSTQRSNPQQFITDNNSLYPSITTTTYDNYINNVPPSVVTTEEDAKRPEILLDYYVEQIHSLHSSLHLLLDRMKSTSVHVQFKLDKKENRLLFYTTLFNGITTILTLGMIFFGFFGMNVSVPESTQALIYNFYHTQTSYPYTTRTFLLIILGSLCFLFLLSLLLIYVMFFTPWLYGFDII